MEYGARLTTYRGVDPDTSGSKKVLIHVTIHTNFIRRYIIYGVITIAETPSLLTYSVSRKLSEGPPWSYQNGSADFIFRTS